MMPIVYLNGDYCSAENATISIFDRSVLFGDAVYEVIPVYAGVPHFLNKHLERLLSNLQKTNISIPQVDWPTVFATLIEQNGGGNLQIYLQVTRGNQGTRKHDAPKTLQPTVFAFTLHIPFATYADKKKGLEVSLLEDKRWLRNDIKSTSLLAAILLNNEAIEQDRSSALLTRDGFLSEGISSNVFIVEEGIIKTPSLKHVCLPGITREIIIELIKQEGLPFQEDDLPIQQLFTASEVWISSTTKEIYPIKKINTHHVPYPKKNCLWEKIHECYQQLIGHPHA